MQAIRYYHIAMLRRFAQSEIGSNHVKAQEVRHCPSTDLQEER